MVANGIVLVNHDRKEIVTLETGSGIEGLQKFLNSILSDEIPHEDDRGPWNYNGDEIDYHTLSNFSSFVVQQLKVSYREAERLLLVGIDYNVLFKMNYGQTT